jgi:hypothetical protein
MWNKVPQKSCSRQCGRHAREIFTGVYRTRLGDSSNDTLIADAMLAELGWALAAARLSCNHSLLGLSDQEISSASVGVHHDLFVHTPVDTQRALGVLELSPYLLDGFVDFGS